MLTKYELDKLRTVLWPKSIWNILTTSATSQLVCRAALNDTLESCTSKNIAVEQGELADSTGIARKTTFNTEIHRFGILSCT